MDSLGERVALLAYNGLSFVIRALRVRRYGGSETKLFQLFKRHSPQNCIAGAQVYPDHGFANCFFLTNFFFEERADALNVL